MRPRGVFRDQIPALLPAETETEAKTATGAAIGWALAAVTTLAVTAVAAVAIARLTRSLRDPLADGVAAAVVTDDLINSDDRRAAGSVTDDSG